MTMRSTAAAAVLAAGLCGAGTAAAETITYDFDGGLPAGFTTFNTGDLFSITTTNAVRISKGTDAGTVVPNGFIAGGVTAPVLLAGDFTATVDFSGLSLPSVAGSKVNEVLLFAGDGTEGGAVYRVSVNNAQFVAFFANSTYPGAPGNGTVSGQFRLQRIGDDLFGYIANSIGGAFNLVGTAEIGTDPFQVSIYAAQGNNLVAPRFNGGLDVTFDNLVLTATDIVGYNDTPVPEPAALALLATGLAGLGLLRRRR